MADETATFTLDLESNAGEVAGDAASALEELKQKLQGDVIALRDMRKAMRNLKGGGEETAGTMKTLRTQIKAQQTTIATSQQSFIRMGGNLGDLSTRGAGAAAQMAEFKKALQGAGGPLGSMVSKLGALASPAVIGVAVIAALVVAVAALTAATAAAVVGLVKYAVAQAGARRSELLRLEGLTKIRRFMVAGGGVGFREVGGDAKFLQTTIDQVAGGVAIARDKVAGLARSFALVGFKGGNLQAAVEGASIALATQGEMGLRQFKAMAIGAAFTGQSVKALADDIKARLGGIAARQMLSLSVLSLKMRENFGLIFKDVKLEALGKAVKAIVDLFGQSTVAGQSLKVILEDIVQPVIDAVTAAGPIVSRFFKGMLIGALEINNFILKLRIAFKKTFGDPELFKGFDAGGAGAAAIKALAVVFGALALTVGAALTPLLLIGGALFAAFKAGENLIDIVRGLGTVFEDVDWEDLGLQITNGIVNGIKSGAGQVIGALTNLGTSGWKAFKNAVEIGSPSKLFKRGGRELPAGVVVGVDSGRKEVERATGRLAESAARGAEGLAAAAPAIPAAPGAGPGATPRGGALANGPVVTLTIGEVNLTSDTDDPAGFVESFRQMLETELEGVAINLGAPTTEPAPA